MILEESKYSEKFKLIFERLAAEGISVGSHSVADAGGHLSSGLETSTRNHSMAPDGGGLLHGKIGICADHVLVVTDSALLAKEAVAEGGAVLTFLHEGNHSEDFSGVRYAFEEPGELDIAYLEQVYRRYKGIPWDILDTKRCHLRETTETDVDAFYHIYEEPSITRYMENLYPEAAQEKEYMRKYIQNVYGFYGFGVWTVIKRDTGEIIGRAGISYREGFDEPELGFVIGVPWQRQGYALEVCKAVLQYGREQLGFTRVQALVQPNNKASLHLCRKLGMVYEGLEILQKKLYIRLVFSIGRN